MHFECGVLSHRAPLVLLLVYPLPVSQNYIRLNSKILFLHKNSFQRNFGAPISASNFINSFIVTSLLLSIKNMLRWVEQLFLFLESNTRFVLTLNLFGYFFLFSTHYSQETKCFSLDFPPPLENFSSKTKSFRRAAPRTSNVKYLF